MLAHMLRATVFSFIALLACFSCNRGGAPGSLQNSRTFEQQASKPDPRIVPEPSHRPPRASPEAESEIERLRRENEALRKENATLKGTNP